MSTKTKSELLKDMMDVEECANFTGISISTLRKMCSAKTIPFHKVNSRVWFHKAEIKTWFMAQKAA